MKVTSHLYYSMSVFFFQNTFFLWLEWKRKEELLKTESEEAASMSCDLVQDQISEGAKHQNFYILRDE